MVVARPWWQVSQHISVDYWPINVSGSTERRTLAAAAHSTATPASHLIVSFARSPSQPPLHFNLTNLSLVHFFCVVLFFYYFPPSPLCTLPHFHSLRTGAAANQPHNGPRFLHQLRLVSLPTSPFAPSNPTLAAPTNKRRHYWPTINTTTTTTTRRATP